MVLQYFDGSYNTHCSNRALEGFLLLWLPIGPATTSYFCVPLNHLWFEDGAKSAVVCVLALPAVSGERQSASQ